MAATPEAPMSLLVMLLERCAEQVKEYLQAQQFPEARPDPIWNGPLMPGPSAEESPPDLAWESPPRRVQEAPPEPPGPRTAAPRPAASQPGQSSRGRPSPRPRSQTGPQAPGRRTPASSRTSAPAALPSAPTPPEHYIPAPVGERHHRRISQDVKIAVSARDGGRCRQCGSTEKLHFDHIIPVSKGGANTIANIQLLCGPCNRSKAAKYPK